MKVSVRVSLRMSSGEREVESHLKQRGLGERARELRADLTLL